MSELREALEKAGLPSEKAWVTFTSGPIDGRVLRCYRADAEAIAKVVVERRIRDISIDGARRLRDSLSLGPRDAAIMILDLLFPSERPHEPQEGET
jgi:hypothetical protein